MTACLDSYALLCWLQDEPSADIVDGLLATQGCVMSMINFGEVFYRLGRTRGLETAEALWEDAQEGVLPVELALATPRRIREAARLKAQHRIAYADGFAIQLAQEYRLPLATGDPEIEEVAPQEGLELVWLRDDAG